MLVVVTETGKALPPIAILTAVNFDACSESLTPKETQSVNEKVGGRFKNTKFFPRLMHIFLQKICIARQH